MGLVVRCFWLVEKVLGAWFLVLGWLADRADARFEPGMAFARTKADHFSDAECLFAGEEVFHWIFSLCRCVLVVIKMSLSPRRFPACR